MLATHAPDWPHRPPDADAVAALRAAYENGGRASVNKYPGNLRIAGVLRRAFPDARFVRVTRDPRDAGLSIYLRDFPDAARFSTDLAAIRAYLEGNDTLAAHWRTLFGEVIHEVAYEDLVTDPEQTLRALLAFLDLPWDPVCLNPAANAAPVATLSHADVRRPVHAGAVGRWRQFGELPGPLLDMHTPE